MASQGWQRLGDVIPAVLRGWQRGLDSPFHRVLEDWEEIVGPEVAKHAAPYSVRDKVLIVLVDSSTWAAEVSRFHAPRIIKALNERLGSKEIRALRCVTRRSTRGDDSAGERHAEDSNDI